MTAKMARQGKEVGKSGEKIFPPAYWLLHVLSKYDCIVHGLDIHGLQFLPNISIYSKQLMVCYSPFGQTRSRVQIP